MYKKERDRINELRYRKARIDRHNTAVNKFLDDAITNKKSVTRAIHELLDREAQLEAQLKQSKLPSGPRMQKCRYYPN
jgi:cell division septum initiation protein DivIVA